MNLTNMKSWNWTSFCGHGERFKPWSGHDFGHCFEQIGILAPSHILLAIVSAYHFGRRRTSLRGSAIYVSWTWFLLLRICAVLFLLIAPIVQIILTLFLEHIRPSISDVLVASLSAISWVFHALYVWNVRYLHDNSLRGPLSAIVALLIVLASNAVHVHTVIILHISGSTHNSDTEKITAFVNTGLCLLYFISIIPNRHRIYHNSIGSSYPINSSLEESEPISWSREHTYGSYDQEHYLVIAERSVGCLSWLSFQWVSRLMSKGAAKKIKTVNDLFILPARLNTKNLEKKFKNVIDSLVLKRNHGQCRASSGIVGTDDENLQESQPQLSTVRIVSPAIQHSGTSPQSDPQTYQSISNSSLNSIDDPNVTSADKVNVGLSFLKAICSTFGLEYFSLGILKLLADCFGFAGPIILNMLVTFIENRSEELYKGYVFASALFLSTLLATLCSTQFLYNVQVVAYKLRCALVTTVYRKSLQVNTVTQVKFTPGEIVNFMSTDVDRILNFCPSFHAFWSLPFQVSQT